MKKTIYCTLDTETVGGATAPTGTYNLGYVIHDRYGNILATTSLLIMEHYDGIRHDDYAKKNFYIYENRLASGEISAVATETDAFNIIRNLCCFYGVKYVMAYNTGFDLVKTVCKILFLSLNLLTSILWYCKQFVIRKNMLISAGKIISVLLLVKVAQLLLKMYMHILLKIQTIKRSIPHSLMHILKWKYSFAA